MQKSEIDASGTEVEYPTGRNLLAMPVGIKQKHNVNTIVQKVIVFMQLGNGKTTYRIA